MAGIWPPSRRIANLVGEFSAATTGVRDHSSFLELFPGIAQRPLCHANVEANVRIEDNHLTSAVPLALVHEKDVQIFFAGPHLFPDARPDYVLMKSEESVDHYRHGLALGVMIPEY